MKGFTKKASIFGLASVMLGAAFGLTGCGNGDGEYKEVGDNVYKVKSICNAYIVVKENEIDTLHKGDIIVQDYLVRIDGDVALTPILQFNCGEELQTYQFIAYTNGWPTPEKYDKVCDCAYELKLQKGTAQDIRTVQHVCDGMEK